MKPSPLCHQLYVENYCEHLCMLPKNHGTRCCGHRTSRDLVPEGANKTIIPFVGTIFFWESEEIPGVWLAYANPPHDVMTQGGPGGGYASALALIQKMIRANRLIEQDFHLEIRY